jgi:hypothetical protein
MILEPGYKHLEFKLFLIGSDGVVQAYNRLKKHYYSQNENPDPESGKKAITLVAKLIAEIRKSVGNEDTKMTYKDAVWWLVKDADKLLDV